MAVALGLTAEVAQPAAAADGTPWAVTAYHHTSEAGDWIGQGSAVAYTPSTASITVEKSRTTVHPPLRASAGAQLGEQFGRSARRWGVRCDGRAV
ncbi:hypothetical protein PWE32_25800 [Streptomyces neyagawaensis]|uniref:hypothetical protein n=1 Tax=Streptomyces neyagawaensis TaxID=42238 RepID=UPI0006E1304D|nr:hypothetical protein [Streptomyces neyagawaensis]MCL6734578.1 hypothetical protein [Streptomyces neyagawaensis]MDE1685692.1 hypothetical protein [Streptomyces neyagawaensis]